MRLETKAANRPPKPGQLQCLPAHRVGRLWKFRLSEVDKWIEAGGAGQDDNEPKPAKKGPR